MICFSTARVHWKQSVRKLVVVAVVAVVAFAVAVVQNCETMIKKLDRKVEASKDDLLIIGIIGESTLETKCLKTCCCCFFFWCATRD
jgi:hypothetical protein